MLSDFLEASSLQGGLTPDYTQADGKHGCRFGKVEIK